MKSKADYEIKFKISEAHLIPIVRLCDAISVAIKNYRYEMKRLEENKKMGKKRS